jgi:hypothetical protein
MATPTGNIGISDVSIELRKSSNSNSGLGDTDVRNLARTSGSVEIGLSDLQGKSILSLGMNNASGSLVQFGGGTALVSIVFNSNGTISFSGTNVQPTAGPDGWSIITSAGLSTSGGGYQMRLFDAAIDGVKFQSTVGVGTILGPGGWAPNFEIMQPIGNGLQWQFQVTHPGGSEQVVASSFTANIIIQEINNESVFVNGTVNLFGSVTDTSIQPQ